MRWKRGRVLGRRVQDVVLQAAEDQAPAVGAGLGTCHQARLGGDGGVRVPGAGRGKDAGRSRDEDCPIPRPRRPVVPR